MMMFEYDIKPCLQVALDYLYSNFGYDFILQINSEDDTAVTYNIVSQPIHRIYDSKYHDYKFIGYHLGVVGKITVDKSYNSIIEKTNWYDAKIKIAHEYHKIEQNMVRALLQVQTQQIAFARLHRIQYSLGPVSDIVYELYHTSNNFIEVPNPDTIKGKNRIKWFTRMVNAGLLSQINSTTWKTENVLSRIYEQYSTPNRIADVVIGIVLASNWDLLIQEGIFSFKPYFELSANYWIKTLRSKDLIPIKITDLSFNYRIHKSSLSSITKKVDELIDAGSLRICEEKIDNIRTVIGDQHTYDTVLSNDPNIISKIETVI